MEKLPREGEDKGKEGKGGKKARFEGVKCAKKISNESMKLKEKRKKSPGRKIETSTENHFLTTMFFFSDFDVKIIQGLTDINKKYVLTAAHCHNEKKYVERIR